MHPTLYSNAVKTVLTTMWLNAFSETHFLPELHLYFGGHVYRDAVLFPGAGRGSCSDDVSFRDVVSDVLSKRCVKDLIGHPTAFSR
jgi:hypothetical protein